MPGAVPTDTPIMSDAVGRDDASTDLASLAPVPTPPLDESSGEAAMRAAIEEAVLKDEGALGQVYRRSKAGESSESIRLARGAEGTRYITFLLDAARTIIEGTPMPTAPTRARRIAQAIRRMLKDNDLAPRTRSELEHRLAILEIRASDRHAKAVEDKEAIQASVLAEEHAVPGIYVYSLPHYLRHPYDEASGRTLMKVGRTDRSAIKRFRDQTRLSDLRTSIAITCSPGSVHAAYRNAIVLPTAPGKSGASTRTLTMTRSPSAQPST